MWGKADMLRTNPAIVGNVISGVTKWMFVALEKINATTCWIFLKNLNQNVMAVLMVEIIIV